MKRSANPQPARCSLYLGVLLLACTLAPAHAAPTDAPLATEPAPAQPAPTAPTAATPVAEFPSRWSGPLHAGPQTLTVDLRVTSPTEATLSIIEQNLADAPLKAVQITDTQMSFRLLVPPMPAAAAADFALKISRDGRTAEGTMTQGGARLPITLKRLESGQAAAVLNRPQHPKAPFPYEATDVTFPNPDTGGTLAGTLTFPRADANTRAKLTAVVLISGSGPQDRDGTILGHKPFYVLADALTRAGIAVLRVDDPGVGASTNPYTSHGSKLPPTTDVFVTDALAAVAFLKEQPRIDPARIGLIGHSEGGVIAPMAAVRSKDVAFIVMLAGTGVNGREVLVSQLAALDRASKTPMQEAHQGAAFQAWLLELLASDLSDEQLKATLAKLAADGGTDTLRFNHPQRTALLDPTTISPWLRSFVKLDPALALRQVSVPVLVLQGGLDCQVVAEVNLPAITRALLQPRIGTPVPDVTVRLLPALNHLLQPAVSGAPDEYAAIETTIDPEALSTIVQWTVARAASIPPAPAAPGSPPARP